MKEQVQFKVVYEWLKQTQPEITDTACICLPCVKQIQRNHNRPNFIPRWQPKVPRNKNKARSLEGCSAALYSQTSLASAEDLQKSNSIFTSDHTANHWSLL